MSIDADDIHHFFSSRVHDRRKIIEITDEISHNAFKYQDTTHLNKNPQHDIVYQALQKACSQTKPAEKSVNTISILGIPLFSYTTYSFK